MEINIIYSPGVVRFLSFFVWGLRKWSDCSFRLVSNGCLPQEQRFLRILCDREDRLEYWCIPTKGGHMPHGEAINYLHALTRGDRFCFMDSDILACGEFMPQLIDLLATHTGVFTGTPLWIKPAEEVLPAAYQIVSGHHQVTDHGMPLGSTYFALYNNVRLTEVMQATGVGFERYNWEEIPQLFQGKLENAGLARAVYDTGKLLNFLIFDRQEQLAFYHSVTLNHLGGVGIRPSYDRPKGWRQRTTDQIPRIITDQIRQFRFSSAIRSRTKGINLTNTEQRAILEQRLQHRDPVRHYFWRLMMALFQGEAPPQPQQTGDPEIDAKVAMAAQHMVHQFDEFRDKTGVTKYHG